MSRHMNAWPRGMPSCSKHITTPDKPQRTSDGRQTHRGLAGREDLTIESSSGLTGREYLTIESSSIRRKGGVPALCDVLLAGFGVVYVP